MYRITFNSAETKRLLLKQTFLETCLVCMSSIPYKRLSICLDEKVWKFKEAERFTKALWLRSLLVGVIFRALDSNFIGSCNLMIFKIFKVLHLQVENTESLHQNLVTKMKLQKLNNSQLIFQNFCW